MSKISRSFTLVLLLVILASPAIASDAGPDRESAHQAVVEVVRGIWSQVVDWISPGGNEFGEIIEPNG